MTAICVYHATDMDGKCSAALVRKFREQVGPMTFIPMNYGWDFPWDDVGAEDVVYMVDFTFSDFSDMLKLQEKCYNLIWIDHHKTAIKRWEEAGEPKLDGLREIGRAGCELVWDWFNQQLGWHGVPPPRFVYLLGRYDVWDHEDPDVLPFQFGMRLDQWDPHEEEWDRLWNLKDVENAVIPDIIATGRVVLKYLDNEDQMRAKGARYLDFQGYPAVAINGAGLNSDRFKYCDYKPADIRIAYFYTSRNFWKVSMYSETVDVSVLAKKMGGGGHAGAAGFQADTEKMIELGLLERHTPVGEARG